VRPGLKVTSNPGTQIKNFADCFFFSGLFWAVSLVTIVMCYLWFTGPGCDTEIALITLTLVFGIGFTVLSMTSFVEHGCKN
jgi:hypothetical protein